MFLVVLKLRKTCGKVISGKIIYGVEVELFKKVFDQKNNSHDSSGNTKFAKQPNVEIFPKIGKTNALSKPVTSNSISTPQEPKRVNKDKVIAPGMFRINPSKISREAKKVPNTVSANSRTKPITVLHPNVITKKNINSNLNGLSSTGLDNTKTRRPQLKSNTKNDRIDSPDVKSKVVYAKCKKCLNSVNHDVCLNNCVNGKKSRGRKHKANISKNETQQKNQPDIKKPKKVGFIKTLATPKPRKPRFLLRWSPTGKMFDSTGKLVALSNSESHVDCSNGDNACISNAMEPKIKRFPNSTSLLGRIRRWRYNLIPAKLKFMTPMLNHQDKYMMKAQESFQDLEHEGGDTRSQGGIKDNDIKIKIQDHSMQMITQRNSQEHKAPSLKKVSHLNDHPLRGDC
nr:hypothetical protein [Tanacetum cinerariifolium]